MSTEALTRQPGVEDRVTTLEDQVLPGVLGRTVFEALAVKASEAAETDGSVDNARFTNSVTRRGDGQTVPDER